MVFLYSVDTPVFAPTPPPAMRLMGRVVTYDHLGFGFSDKPADNYTYSLLDQAEQSLHLWRLLGRICRPCLV